MRKLLSFIRSVRTLNTGCHGKHLYVTSQRTGFATAPADPKDVELAFTTYPEDDSSVDPSKKPLIFLHGLFGAKGNLHSVSKHFSSDGRKVVTYDARNHGDSGHRPEMDYKCMAEDLSDLLDDVKLDRPIVMGHSMGGKTAMKFALTQSEKMTALIVIDVFPGHSPGVDRLRHYGKAMKEVDIPAGTSIVQARKLAQVQLTPVVPDRAILLFLLTNLKEYPDGRIWWRMNLDAFINNLDAIKGFPPTEGLICKKPTLFVFGSESSHYRELDSHLLKKLFPNSELSVIQDAGHFVHADKPLEFVKTVQQFLKKIDASGS